MSRMVERVARDLARNFDGTEAYWKELWVGHAIIAIKALREPTEAMIDAGAVRFDEPSERAIWVAMIDEALK